MQDRYAGDVGDFGKYALLNWLCAGNGDERPALRLGVQWYRFVGAEPKAPNDGKHIRYLGPPSCRKFRPCAPGLWEKMRTVVHSGRSIAAIEASGALPEGTAYYSEPLTFDRRESRDEKQTKRQDWLDRGLQAVAGSDLVFLDPDNGFESQRAKSHHLKGLKYVYYKDLYPHLEARQSLVVYHHFDRSKPHHDQIKDRLDVLCARFGGDRGAFALRYRRGTARSYFVLPAPGRAGLLRSRARSLIDSEWGRCEHFDRCIYE